MMILLLVILIVVGIVVVTGMKATVQMLWLP